MVSTAGDAALTVTDPGQPDQRPPRAARSRCGWSIAPDAVERRRCPTRASTITFKQAIGANEPLRTGSYAKTLTFTLSTTNP